jgi:glycosyltransferase involved in cell wall biosynthesis
MRLPFRPRREGPLIAFFHDFRPPPYGGSNQFLLALRAELVRRGLDVGENRIGPRTRGVILNSYLFDERRLERSKHAQCRVLHRLDGPLARYRGYDDGTDARIAELNRRHADVTVFQSRYSREAHEELGLDVVAPRVIANAVDPEIFHPAEPRPPGKKVRVIATSWSDNPNKGASTFEHLDRTLDLDRFDVTFVGRSASPLTRIGMVEAVPSERLAELLREHDVFLAASRNDPASNALLEGLACGLPAVYHRSGGHAEIAKDAGVPFSADEEAPGALARAAEQHAALRARIEVPTIEQVADGYLDALGLA